MSKILVIVFSFTIFVLSMTAQSGPNSICYEEIKSSVVIVQANDSQNELLSQGTGFFINKNGDIITNFHIINGSSKVNVTTEDRHTYKVKNILGKDISSDFVCLSVDIPSKLVCPIRLNATLPDVGDDIFVIGYAEGLGPLALSMTRGIVSSIQTLNEYGEVIQFDAAVSPGDSGSPLVNAKCEAIGVTTFGLIGGQSQNFAVAYRQLLNLISKIYSGQEQGGKPISKFNLTPEEKLYASGIDLYRKGEYNQSIDYLEKVIELNPHDMKAWSEMASAYVYLRKYDEAIQAFDKIIELDRKTSLPWIEKGKVFLAQYKYDDALTCFTEALELNPQYKLTNCEYAKVWNYKGFTLKSLGRNSEADEAYTKAEELCEG